MRLRAGLPLLLSTLAACSGPAFVDRSKGGDIQEAWPGTVVFEVRQAWRDATPDCIAILPLKGAEGTDLKGAEMVRRALYAHLAPQGKRDVELARIDFVLKEVEPSDLPALARRLRCGAFMSGEVTEARSDFYGFFSRVSVGARLKVVRATDSSVLWEGRHLAASHGGSLPLSPIGLAMGIFDAADNVREEQIFRVADDLARRLIGTIPDDRVAVIDDLEPPGPVPAAAERPGEDPDPFLAGLDGKPDQERRSALLDAATSGRFRKAAQGKILDALLKADPRSPAANTLKGEWLAHEGDYASALAAADRSIALSPSHAPAQFLRGRMLVKTGELDAAEPAFIRAAALDGRNPAYLDGLGLVNALKGRGDRALAAWRMAIDVDPKDGFAWFNSGLVLTQTGRDVEAADAFYGAALAYFRGGDYGRTEKALVQLRKLKQAGLSVDSEIATIEDALASLSRRMNNA